MARWFSCLAFLAFFSISDAAAAVWELELSAMAGDSESGTRAVAGDVVLSEGNDLSFDFSLSSDIVPDSAVGLSVRRFLGPRVALGGEVRFVSYDLVTRSETVIQLTEPTTGVVLLEQVGMSSSSDRVDGYLASIRGEFHFAPERRYDAYVGLSVGTVEFDEQDLGRGFFRDGVDGGATLGALAGVSMPIGSRGTYLGLGVRWDSLTLESRMRNLSELDFPPYSLEGTFTGDDSAESLLFSFQIGTRFGERRGSD